VTEPLNHPSKLTTEADLVAVAQALIGEDAPLSRQERQLIMLVPANTKRIETGNLCHEILSGHDPLGEAFCRIRSPLVRRALGATFTPQPIIGAMFDWVQRDGCRPVRVVDPGAGSGRFLMAAARRLPAATLIGVEVDPLAALLLRANAVVLGFTGRLDLRIEDYRATILSPVAGKTLFIGNPPYLRHHDIAENWKSWFARSAAQYGLTASKLAGLHLHFFLRTLQLAQASDVGAFVTAAEWLDVKYGEMLRRLLVDGLGGCNLQVLEPKTQPFEDAATTAAITCFRVGAAPKGMRLRAVTSVGDLGDLSRGETIPRAELCRSSRWSSFVRKSSRPPSDHLELGEVFRVHRGQVTGCNRVWIAGAHSPPLPTRFLYASITRAKELFAIGAELTGCARLKRVIDLPAHFEAQGNAGEDEKAAMQKFLDWAKSQGAHEGYIASHRRPWWSVRLREPAPILCTYMARRPPAFVRNLAGARHVNIAHGLYPRDHLADDMAAAIVAWLRVNVAVEAGRTYAGGLTKFEPGEIERICIPSLSVIREQVRDGKGECANCT
jgi:hypothetical protein